MHAFVVRCCWPWFLSGAVLLSTSSLASITHTLAFRKHMMGKLLELLPIVFFYTSLHLYLYFYLASLLQKSSTETWTHAQPGCHFLSNVLSNSLLPVCELSPSFRGGVKAAAKTWGKGSKHFLLSSESKSHVVPVIWWHANSKRRQVTCNVNKMYNKRFRKPASPSMQCGEQMFSVLCPFPSAHTNYTQITSLRLCSWNQTATNTWPTTPPRLMHHETLARCYF